MANFHRRPEQPKVPAKKHFGQNFLQNFTIIDQIIAAAELAPTDTILEVGPGRGALTEPLIASGAQINAVEIDTDLLPVLAKKFASKANFTLQNINILEFEPTWPKYKIVANLPYNITGYFFRRFLDEVQNKPDVLVVMVQDEVAKKICDLRKNNLLSLSVQVFGAAEYLFKVGKHNFQPVPQVESAVIKITKNPKITDEKLKKAFFKLINHCFKQKRKKLKNTLASLFPDLDLSSVPYVQDFLESRPEDLHFDTWQNLLEKLR